VKEDNSFDMGLSVDVRFMATEKILLFAARIKPALWLTQPHIWWVPLAISSGINQPEREAAAEVKHVLASLPFPHMYSQPRVQHHLI
jgi:hypothetical protein